MIGGSSERDWSSRLRQAFLFMDGLDQSVLGLSKIYGLLNDYSWHVATALILSGELVQVQTVEADSDAGSPQISDEFQADFKAIVGVPGVFRAEGAGGEHTKNGHDDSRLRSLLATHCGGQIKSPEPFGRGLISCSFWEWLRPPGPSIQDPGTFADDL
mgnify:CR=1 FL=1